MQNKVLADTLTIGQYRVGVTFNPGNNPLVDEIKRKSAELIDLCQSIKNDEASKTYDKSPQEKNETSGEIFRLIALAQTHYEDAAMWAVKAATKPIR